MLKSARMDKLNAELGTLKREVRTLRSFLISVVGKDEEGAYRPQFVREVLRAAREQPTRSFENAHSLLKELERA